MKKYVSRGESNDLFILWQRMVHGKYEGGKRKVWEDGKGFKNTVEGGGGGQPY